MHNTLHLVKPGAQLAVELDQVEEHHVLSPQLRTTVKYATSEQSLYLNG